MMETRYERFFQGLKIFFIQIFPSNDLSGIIK
jgi:hypothetical protein